METTDYPLPNLPASLRVSALLLRYSFYVLLVLTFIVTVVELNQYLTTTHSTSPTAPATGYSWRADSRLLPSS